MAGGAKHSDNFNTTVITTVTQGWKIGLKRGFLIKLPPFTSGLHCDLETFFMHALNYMLLTSNLLT